MKRTNTENNGGQTPARNGQLVWTVLAIVLAAGVWAGAWAQNTARSSEDMQEALQAGMASLKGLAELINGDYNPTVQRNSEFNPSPAAAQGSAALNVIEVTDATIRVMLHVSGMPSGAASPMPAYMVNGTTVTPDIDVTYNNYIGVNGSYVQVVRIPATAANNRLMTATLTYTQSGAQNVIAAPAVTLPKQSVARYVSAGNGGTYYSEISGGTAYRMLNSPTFLCATSYHSALNIVGRNNLRTSFDHAWALWFGGADNLTKWTSAKPLPGTDFMEISFYMYNPTSTTVSNARIALYNDVYIGNNDDAPIDPLRSSITNELIGFLMSDLLTVNRNTLALVNMNAGKYGSETAPNEWGAYSGRCSVGAWDRTTATTTSFSGYDSDAIARVRDITVPAGALRVYTFYVGAGDLDNIIIDVATITGATNITGVPTEATVGIPLTITGTVVPDNATYSTIVWSITNAGGTGAVLTGGNVLNTTAPGIVEVKGTIVNGIAEGVDYTKNFTITVTHTITISGVPTATIVCEPLSLTGTVTSSLQVSAPIKWSLINAGTTDAALDTATNIFSAPYMGTAVIRATIAGANSDGTDYTQNFTIAVNDIPITGISGVPSSAIVGVPLQLYGTVSPDNPANQAITWSVANAGSTGASIQGGYVFTASAPGVAVVRAAVPNGSGGSSYTRDFDITVNIIPVTDITGIPASVTVNTPLPLLATIEPSNATNQTITWSVADPGTTGAGILHGYLLTAPSSGTVVLRANVANGTAGGSFTKDFTVTVNFVPVTGISGVPTSVSAGTLQTLPGTVLPSNATNSAITWSMVNAGGTGATVIGSVLRTTLTPGTVVVRAAVANGTASGNYTEDFTIAVNPISITITSALGTGAAPPAYVGVAYPLSGTVEPANAPNRDITWSVISGPATLGGTGTNRTITASSPGTVTVRATVATYTRDFAISVTTVPPVPVPDPEAEEPTPDPFVAVTGITNVPTAATVNVPLTLTGTVAPGNATNRAIVWTVSNAGYTGAAIYNGNELRATGSGTVTLQATITNGSSRTTPYTRTFTITVNSNTFVAVTGITNVPTAATVNVPLTLTGTVAPANATNQTIIWSVVSAGTTGAVISNNNTLGTTAAGTVTVRATIPFGASSSTDFSRDFNITVSPVYVTDITGIPSSLTVGSRVTLNGTVNPSTATNRVIAWSVVSAGTTGAVIESGNVLKVPAAGTVVLRATVANGTASGSYTKDFIIAVNAVPVTNITGIPAETVARSTLSLLGTVIPADATNQTITWSVVNAGTTGAVIASGNVLSTPAAGTLTVRATIANGGTAGIDYTKEFTITVNRLPGITSDYLIYNLSSVVYNARPQGIPAPAAICGVTGLGAITVKYDGETDRPVNVDTYVVTVDIAESPVYNAVTGLLLGDFAITTRPIRGLPLFVDTKVYDGTRAATMDSVYIAADTSWGAIAGDNLIFVMVDGLFSTPNVGRDIPVTAQMLLCGTAAANYELVSLPELSGEIVPKSLTITGTFVEPKVYDGTNAASVVGIFDDGIVDGDQVDLVITESHFVAPDAGSGIPVSANISLGGASAQNYTLVQPTLTGNITPRPLAPDALLPIIPQIYTGVDVTPQTTVMDGSRVLVRNVDYIVVYENNVHIGDSSTVTIVGIGNYTGEAFGAFRIQRGRGARLWAGPNPVSRSSGGMKIYWQGRYFGSGVLHVYDRLGSIVTKIDIQDDVQDSFDKRLIGSWDLTNSSGRYVAAGTYLIRGMFVTDDGRREEKQVLVGVK